MWSKKLFFPSRQEVQSLIVKRLGKTATEVQKPDEPFHNFGTSRSGDRRILCSPGTSCDGFGSSRIVKEFVGKVKGVDFYARPQFQNFKIRRSTNSM